MGSPSFFLAQEEKALEELATTAALEGTISLSLSLTHEGLATTSVLERLVSTPSSLTQEGLATTAVVEGLIVTVDWLAHYTVHIFVI